MSNPIESFVQVATDGVGKRMRNASRYVVQPDGTVQLTFEEYVQLVDQWGTPLDLTSQLDDLLAELKDFRASLEESLGIVAVTGGTEPVKKSLVGVSGLPAKANQYNPLRAISDQFGRQITLPVASRDLLVTQGTTISASTSETTVVTGLPGVFLDIVMFIISNTSAATSTRIDVRDTTAGTILFSLQSVGGAAPIGFALPVPIPQTTAGSNWTMQCATSTTDIRVYALAVRNK